VGVHDDQRLDAELLEVRDVLAGVLLPLVVVLAEKLRGGDPGRRVDAVLDAELVKYLSGQARHLGALGGREEVDEERRLQVSGHFDALSPLSDQITLCSDEAAVLVKILLDGTPVLDLTAVSHVVATDLAYKVDGRR